MLAAALVFGIATACQVIAPKFRVPGLILLLPAGFILGLIAPQYRWDAILGPAFPVVVDLIVALILFQGGMSLGTIQLKGRDKNVVRRLIWIGGPISCVAGLLLAHFLLGFSWQLSFMLGAILIVSGPTVVTPILDFVQPEPRVRRILQWEGTMLDPLGAIFAVVVFQFIRVTSGNGPVEALGLLVKSFTVAIAFAIIGVLLVVLGTKLVRGNAMLGMQVLLGSVILAAGFANAIAPESGLLTALLMGAATHPLARRLNTSVGPAEPFFNTVASIGVGVLFVSIAALVPSPVLLSVLLPAIAVAVLLILIVRPFIAVICTRSAGLSRKQRAFIGWMDPRGIVAAATASSIGAALVAAHVSGADQLLPVAFIIITVTVFVYGLTAYPVANTLGIREPEPAAST